MRFIGWRMFRYEVKDRGLGRIGEFGGEMWGGRIGWTLG
jgi:hypothetical protein